jgi:RNA polymerase sigma-70 factor (family 1)
MKIVSTDTELLFHFREGEEFAVHQIYKLHYRSLCYFADRLLNHKDEAEDIVADSFIKLLDKRAEFDDLNKIRLFLYSITRNACIDILRRDKRRANDHRIISYLTNPGEEQTDHELITAKVLEMIYREIELLPLQCRKVFTSIFIEGKSTHVIAEELGISTQTVLNQKTRAVQLIRTKLYSEGYRDAGLFLYCLLLLASHAKV